MAVQLPVAPPPELGRPLRMLFILTILVFAGLFVLAVSSSGAFVQALALAGAAAAVWAVWRFPIGATIAFVVLIPLHRLILMVTYDLSGSLTLLRALQLWDDALLSVLLVRVLHETFLRRRAPTVRLLDLLILGFVAFTALYVLYPGTLEGTSFLSRFSGFRFDAMFLMAYFVGRGLPVERRHVRALLIALVPCAIVAAGVAVWQWIAPGQANAVFRALGYAGFISVVGGSGDIVVRSRELGGTDIPRASSILLGDLALSFYMLFLLPFGAAFFFHARTTTGRVAAGAFLIAVAGALLLTVTRSAVLAGAAVLVLLTIVARTYDKTIWFALASASIALTFVAVSGLTGDSFQELFSPGESSAVAHKEAFENSLQIVREDPLGRGLATAGPLAQRDKVTFGITNESWYLQLATEIGIVAAVLFAITLLCATVSAFVSYLRVKDVYLRVLTLGVAGAGIGFALVGAVLHVWEVTSLSMLFWLLTGIAVRAREIEAQDVEDSGDSTGSMPAR